MAEKLLVFLGYYHRYNLGDETFMKAFSSVLKDVPEMHDHTPLFLNTDDIKVLPKETAMVVCGGGDIFNSYFLDKIHKILLNSCYTGPVIAMSTGMPDPSMVRIGKLDIFDKIICRFKDDVEPIAERIGKQNVTHLPDVTCYLYNQPHPTLLEPRPQVDIGVFLARPICSNIDGYEKLVDGISQSLDSIHDHLIFCGYQPTFHLIPFNTDPKNNKEDDRIINEQVFDKCQVAKCVMYNHLTTFEEVQPKIEQMDVCICMRFHAHVFSFMSCKPVLSINVTPKVTKLCKSFDYEYVYSVPRSEKGYPECISADEVTCLFQRLWMDRKKVFQSLCQHRQHLFSRSQFYQTIFAMMSKPQILIRKNHPSTKPKVNSNEPVTKVAKQMITLMVQKLKLQNVDIDSESKLISSSKKNFKDLIRNESIEEQNVKDCAHGMARIMCFALTKTSFPLYHWGLSEQLFADDYNLKSSWEWLQEDWTKQETNVMNGWSKRVEKVIEVLNVNEDELPHVDLMHVEQLDYAGVHRSGWQFVVNHLFPLHRDGAMILDTYMDKTFGWCSSFYESIGVLPFNRSWMGFIHHTFAVDYSENNAHALLHNPLFQQSLPFCKGLIVLSEDLKNKVYNELLTILKDEKLVPKVHVLHHPTDFVDSDKQFTIEKFITNPNKKVVQVGAWLRDPFGIYRVPLEEEFMNPMKVKKAALQGKAMENYFRPKRVNIVLTSEDENKSLISRCACQCTCRKAPTGLDDLCPCDKQAIPNKWVHGLLEFIEDTQSKVETLKHLTNDEYDTLLSNNIVFLNLKDASAANTIIECMVRNTPVLVNPLPAVVEYLGPDYPFYYSSFGEAAFKCADLQTITSAYQYLKTSLRCDELRIQTFFSGLTQIIEQAV